MPHGYEVRDHILQVKGISLKLGGNQILRDLSFEIRDIHRDERVTGQIVGLLGPSGIGKTQLFRILAGLGKPDSGEVLVGSPGKTVERGMVGVVAQQYPLFEHRTVWSNLMVAAARSGRSEADSEKRGHELLDRFKLLDRKSFYPAQLSGGQRQRVALARAFDLRVVAEGVESSGQVEQLRAIGCTEAQGFLFAKAMPEREVADFLTRHASAAAAAAARRPRPRARKPSRRR